RLAHAGQLLLAGAEVHVDELAPERPEHERSRQHPLAIEGATEGNHRRLGDDCLVEVEEGGGLHRREPTRWANRRRFGAQTRCTLRRMRSISLATNASVKSGPARRDRPAAE